MKSTRVIRSLYSVIVNWNLKEDTLACVDSLLAAGARADQIIVVDNGSTDGSVPALRERFGSTVYLIESERNLGFAGGSNAGIRHALEQGAERIFLLNNDTVIAPTFFVELEQAITAGPEFAIVAPLILEYHAPQRIWYLGDRLVPASLITRSLYRGQIDTGHLPPLVPVDFVSGCGMLIKRAVFEQIGLFDPRFFMYAEEIDFCWRARKAGFRLACATRAKMWHKVSASAGRDLALSRYLRIRNQIQFYRRHARPAQLPLMVVFTLLRAGRIALGDLVHRQPALIAPLARGWAHGWLRSFEETSDRQKPV